MLFNENNPLSIIKFKLRTIKYLQIMTVKQDLWHFSLWALQKKISLQVFVRKQIFALFLRIRSFEELRERDLKLVIKNFFFTLLFMWQSKKSVCRWAVNFFLFAFFSYFIFVPLLSFKHHANNRRFLCFNLLINLFMVSLNLNKTEFPLT